MTQHSALSQQPKVAQHFLLATLLAFCSEILLWTNPPSRGVLDWLLLALGYLALSGLLLEIADRYRVRDAFGLLALAGIYGMLNGLILNPQSALVDSPRTLITRAMGAHAFAGLIALALFLGLTGSRLRFRRGLLVALVLTLIVGVGWGAWAHWSPLVIVGQPESPSETLLIYAGAGITLIVLALLAVRRSAAPADLRLRPRGWAFMLVVLIGLTIVHLLRAEVDGLSLTVLVTLSAFSVMILWFHKRKKGSALFEGLANTPHWTALFALIVVFAAAGAVGYELPRGEGNSDPLALIGALFTAYGLIWLPAISLVLGARAFSRQARAMNL